jgi:hypothetical protein
MKFDIVTIFPRMVEAGLAEGVISRGVERGLLDIKVHGAIPTPSCCCRRRGGGSPKERQPG